VVVVVRVAAAGCVTVVSRVVVVVCVTGSSFDAHETRNMPANIVKSDVMIVSLLFIRV
jgi:hypothetical protein